MNYKSFWLSLILGFGFSVAIDIVQAETTPIVPHENQEITYFHHDATGSVIAKTDHEGNPTFTDYQAYGNPTGETPNVPGGSIGFTGKPAFKDLGLNYLGARWYDPITGRFMGIDPVDPHLENIHSLNRYTYANNNPYKYVDPDGRSAVVGDLGVGSTYDVSGDIDSISVLGAEVTASDIYLGTVGIVAAEFAAGQALASSTASSIGGFFGRFFNSGAIRGAAQVPGRVQSRINLSNNGIKHTLDRHLNPAKARNKSQFTIGEDGVRSLLGSKSTVQSPARALETGNFARTVKANKIVGNLAEKMGGRPTVLV